MDLKPLRSNWWSEFDLSGYAFVCLTRVWPFCLASVGVVWRSLCCDLLPVQIRKSQITKQYKTQSMNILQSNVLARDVLPYGPYRLARLKSRCF